MAILILHGVNRKENLMSWFRIEMLSGGSCMLRESSLYSQFIICYSLTGGKVVWGGGQFGCKGPQRHSLLLFQTGTIDWKRNHCYMVMWILLCKVQKPWIKLLTDILSLIGLQLVYPQEIIGISNLRPLEFM